MDDEKFIPIAEADPEEETSQAPDESEDNAAEEVLPEDVMGTSKKEEKPRKKKSKLFKPVLAIVIICFCLFAVADIVTQQNEIEQLEQETETMRSKIEESKQLSDEYQQMLNADEAEFMERVAVEQLGYAYPNERRFYIVNGSDQ